MTVAPHISVIIPCRNDESTIGRAVDSVIAQGWPQLDVLICDDGSTDHTVAIATERLEARGGIPFQVLRFEGNGAAVARNAGLDAASGDFVAFLDSDDEWRPTKLARCMAVVSDGVDIVAHSEEWRSSAGSRDVHYSHLLDPSVPLPLGVFRQNPFSTSAMMIRRTIADRAGRFDVSLPSAEDYDYWIRLSLIPGVRVAFVDEVLGVYTLRAGSDSSRIDARNLAMTMIGDRYLPLVAPMAAIPLFEGPRYRSKVRMATGARLVSAGQVIPGMARIVGGLLQWPWRPDLVRFAMARLAPPKRSP